MQRVDESLTLISWAFFIPKIQRQQSQTHSKINNSWYAVTKQTDLSDLFAARKSSMDKKITITNYLWGGICTLFGAFSLNDWALIVGMVVSVASFIYNIYHKQQLRKELKNKKWFKDEEIN